MFANKCVHLTTNVIDIHVTAVTNKLFEFVQ